MNKVIKEEVEQLLRYQITDEQFEQALNCASRKRDYIYRLEQRPVVLQHWYLVKLTEEYIRCMDFSKATEDWCSKLQDMDDLRRSRKSKKPISGKVFNNPLEKFEFMKALLESLNKDKENVILDSEYPEYYLK